MVPSSKLYQVNNRQYTFRVSKLGENFQLLDVIKIDDTYEGLVRSDSHIYKITESGQIKLTHQMEINQSKIVSISSTQVAYYSPIKNSIAILNLATLEVQEEINKTANNPRNEFSLFYFKQIQMFAWIEKHNEQNKLDVCYLKQKYSQQDDVLSFTVEDKWKGGQQIYKTNEFGLIAWPSLNNGKLNIQLYTPDFGSNGIKTLQLQSKVLSTLSIGTITNDGSNKLHIGLMGEKSNNLPIIMVETSKNFDNVVREQKVKNQQERDCGQIKGIYNLGDFIGFESIIQGNAKILIYSLQTQSIVQSYFLKEKTYTLIESLSLKGTLIQNSKHTSSKKQLSSIMYQIKRKSNLQMMKLLQAHSRIIKISQNKDKAVLFFGTNGSGKSTFISYLCQRQLEHIYHEDLAYYELKLKQKEEKKKSQESNQKFVQVQENKLGALIEIPDWSQSQDLHFHIKLLMQQIIKNFKQIHVVVTIPYEQIQQSITYQKIIEQILILIQTSNVGLKDINLGDNLSILLTKIEDSEAPQLFKDYIELMKEQNSLVASLLERVNEKQRIILFENKPYDTHEGEEASTDLFSADMFATSQTCQESKNSLVYSEQGKNLKEALIPQLKLYSRLVNKLFLYISHLSVDIPSIYNFEQLEDQNYHLNHPFKQFIPQNEDKNQLIYSFFMALSELKITLQKQSNFILQRTIHIQRNLEVLEKQCQKITSYQDCELLRKTFDCFVSSLILLLDYFIKQNSEPFEEALFSLKNEFNGILGKTFAPVIQKLSQNQLVSNQKSILKQFDQYLAQKSCKPIVRIIKKQLSYEQQRALYLRDKKKMLDTICALPANAMKLDLILEQIFQYLGKQKIDNQDIRPIRYYLREASRICHFHQLYVEAIILLMVIPDFIGIQVLLDEMVQYCKKKNPIQSRKLLGKEQQEIIDELIIICRQCLRDSLVSKLIYIKSLNKQINSKQIQIKKLQNNSRNKQLLKQENIEKYQQKLRLKTELIYYNIKNTTFKDLIQKRGQVIDKCQNYEKDQSASKFADIQALNWVIQRTPIPI